MTFQEIADKLCAVLAEEMGDSVWQAPPGEGNLSIRIPQGSIRALSSRIGISPQQQITFEALDDSVREIASRIKSMIAEGERVYFIFSAPPPDNIGAQAVSGNCRLRITQAVEITGELIVVAVDVIFATESVMQIAEAA